jgi:hypothetical protein
MSEVITMSGVPMKRWYSSEELTEQLEQVKKQLADVQLLLAEAVEIIRQQQRELKDLRFYTGMDIVNIGVDFLTKYDQDTTIRCFHYDGIGNFDNKG